MMDVNLRFISVLLHLIKYQNNFLDMQTQKLSIF